MEKKWLTFRNDGRHFEQCLQEKKGVLRRGRVYGGVVVVKHGGAERLWVRQASNLPRLKIATVA